MAEYRLKTLYDRMFDEPHTVPTPKPQLPAAPQAESIAAEATNPLRRQLPKPAKNRLSITDS